jgi:uncharacterized protein YdaU (DUF1376 family)
MGIEKAPAFPFYVRDWRASRKVQRMTYGERGMYLEMLSEEWDQGAAPATAADCASTLGGSLEEWAGAWPKLVVCFVPRRRDGLLINRKLESIRREKRKYHNVQSQNGLAGAQKRWRRHGDAIAKNGFASALASASASADQKNPPTPLAGGSTRATRAEIKHARAVLKVRLGRCRHDPACDNGAACVLAIVAEVRERSAVAS